MKLNKKQKEYLFKEMFEPYDIYKIFDTISKEWVLEQDIEIMEGNYGWWDLFMNGEKYTGLNFKTYPKVLKNIENM